MFLEVPFPSEPAVTGGRGDNSTMYPRSQRSRARQRTSARILLGLRALHRPTSVRAHVLPASPDGSQKEEGPPHEAARRMAHQAGNEGPCGGGASPPGKDREGGSEDRGKEIGIRRHSASTPPLLHGAVGVVTLRACEPPRGDDSTEVSPESVQSGQGLPPASSAQRFPSPGASAQPQWLKLQSIVPPRQSIVHSVPFVIIPALAAATQRAAWHSATGSQSVSFTQLSSEKTGDFTAVLIAGITRPPLPNDPLGAPIEAPEVEGDGSGLTAIGASAASGPEMDCTAGRVAGHAARSAPAAIRSTAERRAVVGMRVSSRRPGPMATRAMAA